MRHIVFNYGLRNREKEIALGGKEEGDVFKLLLPFSMGDIEYTIHYFSYGSEHINLFKNSGSKACRKVVSSIFLSLISYIESLKKDDDEILVLLHMGMESDLSFINEEVREIALPSVRLFKGGRGPVYEKIISKWESKWMLPDDELLAEKISYLEEVWKCYFIEPKKRV